MIQVRNDYDNDIFTGDVGRVLEVGRGALLVDFEGREPDWAVSSSGTSSRRGPSPSTRARAASTPRSSCSSTGPTA